MEHARPSSNFATVYSDHTPLNKDSREAAAHFVHLKLLEFLPEQSGVGGLDVELLQGLPQHPRGHSSLEVSYLQVLLLQKLEHLLCY